MLLRSKLVEVLRSNLCSGCGACYSICSANAINMRVALDGTYKPFIDPHKCTKCGLCERVCPSLSGTPKAKIKGLGNFINCYIGYSTDTKIRWEASSGGVVTTILLSLFEEGLISGAVIVKKDPKDSLKPSMILTNSKEDIIEAMGSKYCPAKPSFRVKDLVNVQGKVAIVGLPCHIWAFRNLEKIDKRLKDKILIHLGLFCGKKPNFYATVYFIRKIVGVNEREVVEISYRGKGWPGKLTVMTKRGESYSFELGDWISFSYYPHFIPIRCVFCYDITNQQADISLGDAWGLAHDNIGTSVIITRTPVGENIIQYLHKTGKLVLREVDPKQVSQGQGLEDKVSNTLIRAYIWRRIFHKPTPYELSYPPQFSLKEWVLNLGYCLWLYVTQNKFIRATLCNLNPLVSEAVRWIRWMH